MRESKRVAESLKKVASIGVLKASSSSSFRRDPPLAVERRGILLVTRALMQKSFVKRFKDLIGV